jgi:transposase
MRENDARKLTHKELTELRKRGVSAVQDGQPPKLVAKVLGVQRSTLFGWLARYRRGGWGALDARKRGGRPPKLTARMLEWIYNTVAMKDPRQMKFPFALWTSVMVAELVWRQFGIRLSKASVCRLLNQLGLSPQKPLWHAFQQDPERVEKWVKEEYPKIRTLAREQKADIFFGDEAGVRSDFHSGKTWALRGKTPIVSATGARFGCNMLSAVSPKGAMRFMLVNGRITASVFVDFLKRLIHNWPRSIFLIIDGHPVHKSIVVSKFVASTAGRLQLFLLPPYSPELNPDEQVWNHLKNHGVGRQPVTGPDQLRRLIISHLRKVQKLPSLIRSFFNLPETAYAAVQ